MVGQAVPRRFCGLPDSDGHLSRECTFPPLVEIRENPEFHDLMRMDSGHWPRCLLWHGWLPMFSGVNGASPWAADASESAGNILEAALGSYSSRILSEWSVPEVFDAAESAARMPNLSMMVISFCSLIRCYNLGCLDTVRITKVKVMLMKMWFLTDGFVSMTGWGQCCR